MWIFQLPFFYDLSAYILQIYKSQYLVKYVIEVAYNIRSVTNVYLQGKLFDMVVIS